MRGKTAMKLINRWRAHWQALPARNRAGAALCLVVLIILGFALAYQIRGLLADFCKNGQASHPAAVQDRV